MGKIKEFLSEFDIFIKKKYGQNFLIDKQLLAKIASIANLTKDINVIEIGTGIGSLTKEISEKANKVLTYEIDRQLIEAIKFELRGSENYFLLEKDFLKASIANDIALYFDDQKEIYLVANLPYYITTKILEKVIKEGDMITNMYVMVQEEVANKLIKQDPKERNVLSFLIEYAVSVEKKLYVPKEAFYPQPNIGSAIIHLERKKVHYEPHDKELLFSIIEKGFKERRKTLANNLAHLGNKATIESLIESLGYKANARIEEFQIHDVIKLTNLLQKHMLI